MLRQLFDEQKGGILGLFNMFSGGALSRFSVFALGIMPYISAAIIMQMLSYVLPSLEALRALRAAASGKPLRDLFFQENKVKSRPFRQSDTD